MKTCTNCKKSLEYSCFNKRTKSPDGLAPICKSCKSVKDRTYQENGAKNRRLTESEIASIPDLYATEKSLAKVAKLLGVSKQTVKYHIDNPPVDNTIAADRFYSVLTSQNRVVLSKWIDSSTPVPVMCMICREIRSVIPNNVVAHGHGCSVCAGNDTYTAKAGFLSMLANQNRQLHSEWNGVKNKVSILCNKCFRLSEQRPDDVLSGCGCPVCANVGPSRGQLEVHEYIKSLCPDAILSDRMAIKPLELDTFVPSKMFGFEYNGLYFHSSAMSSWDMKRHQKKAEACRKAGINLLMIYEDEWQNKRELVKAMIRWRLGKFDCRVANARDLVLKRLDHNSDFEAFFEEFHLDGHTQASFAYGLFDNDCLLCCASVRKNFNGEWELARLATNYNVNIRGGASRLVKAIMKEIQAPLISFSNNRLSSGKVYEKMGFTKLSDNAPSYWYTDGRARIWRFKCKRINDPEILAEFPTEKAQALGGVFSRKYLGHSKSLYQISDAGHMKWILKQ